MDLPSDIPDRESLKQINSYNLMLFLAVAICVASIIPLTINLDNHIYLKSHKQAGPISIAEPWNSILIPGNSICLEVLL